MATPAELLGGGGASAVAEESAPLSPAALLTGGGSSHYPAAKQPVEPPTRPSAGLSPVAAILGETNTANERANALFATIQSGQPVGNAAEEWLKQSYSQADLNMAKLQARHTLGEWQELQNNPDLFDKLTAVWNHPYFNAPIVSLSKLPALMQSVGEAAARTIGPDASATLIKNGKLDKASELVTHYVNPAIEGLGEVAEPFTTPKAILELLAGAKALKYGGAAVKGLLAASGLATAAAGAHETGAALGKLSVEQAGTPEADAAYRELVGGGAEIGLGALLTLPAGEGMMQSFARRAATKASGTAASILEATRVSDGGVFDPVSGKPFEPKDGFGVGKVRGDYSTPINPENPTLMASWLARLAHEHPNARANTRLLPDGSVVVEPIEHIPSREEAFRLGAERLQDGVINFKTGKVEPIPSEFRRAYAPPFDPTPPPILINPKLAPVTWESLPNVKGTGAEPIDWATKPALRKDYPEASQLADAVNVRFDGVMETVPGKPNKWQFTDPKTGSTFYTDEGADVPQLRKKLAANREPFAEEHGVGKAPEFDAANPSPGLSEQVRPPTPQPIPQPAARQFVVAADGTARPTAPATPGQLLLTSGEPSEAFSTITGQGGSGDWAGPIKQEDLFTGTEPHGTARDILAQGEPTADGGRTPPPPRSIFNTANAPMDSDPAQWPSRTLGQWLQKQWESLWPRSAAMIKENPNTYAMSGLQRFKVNVLSYITDFSQEGWYKDLRKLTPEQIAEDEHNAITAYWKARTDDMLSPSDAFDKAMEGVRPEMASYFRHRVQVAPQVQAACSVVGIEPFDLVEGPYLPRLTTEDFKAVTSVKGFGSNLVGNLRTTAGSFGKSREFASLKDGMAGGIDYEKPIRAIWMREWTDIKLMETARLINDYKANGVLFENAEAAKAASPTGEPHLVRGLAGNDFWTPTRQEGLWLGQNLRADQRSEFGKLTLLANATARNPNLINPLPHAAKNIFFKFALGIVREASFKETATELKNATPSALALRFEQVMPFDNTGKALNQVTTQEIGSWGTKALNSLTKVNQPSTWFTFAKADPFFRYNLWKYYVGRGMSDQEAANHVFLDLVKYDERSGAMDFWRSVPFNFFTAWRAGTLTSISKSFATAPIRTSLYVGAIDYLREIRYRSTGKWTHLPSDYFEGPISELAYRHDPMASMAIAATTIAFGPGGSQTPATIDDVMKFVRGDPGALARVKNMFWGMSQIYNLPREITDYEKTGDPQHLINVLTAAALAEHTTLTYQPRRLASILPESWPGMQKAWFVAEAERLQATASARRERYGTRPPAKVPANQTIVEEQLRRLRKTTH